MLNGFHLRHFLRHFLRFLLRQTSRTSHQQGKTTKNFRREVRKNKGDRNKNHGTKLTSFRPSQKCVNNEIR